MVQIYAIGSNGSGQLGIGHQEDVSVPKEVLFEVSETMATREPPKIRAGGNHTLLVQAGLLFCSGDYSTGACGTMSDGVKPFARFKKTIIDNQPPSSTDESNIVLAAATWEASFIVKRDGHGQSRQLYSFGTGNKGELGLGELIFRSPRGQLIEDFPPPDTEIIDLAASVSHIIAVLSNGDVYGWGAGRKGQLGQPETIVHSPRKISGIDFQVTRAVCGREFTYLLGKPENGEHIVIGADKWNIKSSAPLIVKEWKNVGASWGSLYVLLSNGTLLSWGRDDHGQLAPTGLPQLSEISVGSEHVLGLTSQGDVLAWGWGEHGNCGPNTTNGDVNGRWNVVASSNHLPIGSRIISVGSGCATSWICIGS